MYVIIATFRYYFKVSKPCLKALYEANFDLIFVKQFLNYSKLCKNSSIVREFASSQNIEKMTSPTFKVTRVSCKPQKITKTSYLISKASFCNFFLQLPTASEILRIFIIRCFKLFSGILYCNFLQLFCFLHATFYCNFLLFAATFYFLLQLL